MNKELEKMRHQKILYSLIFLFIFQTNIHSKEQCPQTDPLTWTNCIGKKTNEKGDKYEGEFLNGKYHGYGRYIFKNGEIYEGYFANGKKHGKGKEIFTDGSVYEGELFENNRQGKGIFTIGDWKYVGDFKNHVREGKGILYYPNGSIYDGEFRNNVKSGTGVIKSIQKNNVVITGSGKFKDDKLTEGTVTSSDGSKYSGFFKNDLYEGSGKRTYINGDIIEGIFKEGKLTPNSVTYYLKAGDKFIGDFDKEVKHYKNGTYFHVNGDRYVGSFDEKNNKLNGVHYYANNTSAKVTNGKYEWLNPPVVSSKQNTPAFTAESIKPRKGGFFSTIIGVLSFFVIPILMYKPVVYSLNSTNNSAFKIGIILISLFIFYAALISLHSFIGFSTGACHPQLGRFSDC
jgi:hypothetical protein